MITYNLTCAKGHEFEGWFKDSTAYDEQEAGGVLNCPSCGDGGIRKAIMAPSVKHSTTRGKGKTEMVAPAGGAPDAEKLRELIAGYRKFIKEHADYVGPSFPEEARKIHYGEAEERHIYGETTLAEAKELIEEGIAVAPVPSDPNDLN